MSASGAVAARRRGGVLLRVEGATVFLPASMAVKVAEKPKIARLAGAPPEVLGIALFEGALIPIVSLSPQLASPEALAALSGAAPAMVVCQHEGERLGLMGLEVVASGTFASCDDDAAAVLLEDGTRAPTFDVGELYARLQGARSGLGLAPAASTPTPRSSP